MTKKELEQTVKNLEADVAVFKDQRDRYAPFQGKAERLADECRGLKRALTEEQVRAGNEASAARKSEVKARKAERELKRVSVVMEHIFRLISIKEYGAASMMIRLLKK